MTSRSLFFKRMRQDLDQRIWLPVIYFIITFLSMELVLISRIDNWKDSVDYAKLTHEYLMDSFWGLNVLAVIFTCAMAVICALSCFSYMHSAKKLDVYHSIPIKRERLFGQQYLYGILYYFVPTLLHVLICLGICTVNGVCNGKIIWQAMCFLISQLLFFIVCYAASIVAVCLTGNLVVSVLGTAVLLVYSLILMLLKAALIDRYFVTYYSSDNTWQEAGAFSPVHLICKMIYQIGDADTAFVTYNLGFGIYLKLALMALIYTALALYLYKKRPGEVAGCAIAFRVTEPFIKTMVVFPVSFLCGYIFSNIVSHRNEMVWFVVGCVFGFMLLCPLMEIIFRKDVKAVFKHPIQILINGVFIISVVAVMHFDLLGYDTYIPAEREVESCAVYFGELPSIYGGYSTVQNQLEHMKINDNESTRKLLEHAAELTRPARKGTFDQIIEQDKENGMDGEHYRYTHAVVRYNLKNGREIYRSYLINVAESDVMKWIGDTFEDPAYKQVVYPVLNENWGHDYNSLHLEYHFSSEEIKLTKEQKEAFLDVYRKDLFKLTLEELVKDIPVAEFAFAKSKYDHETGYYIYPSFTNTIEMLKILGAEMVNRIPAEVVKRITVDDYTREVYDNDGLNTKEIILVYDVQEGQEKKIEEILNVIAADHMIHSFEAEERVEEYIYVNIEYSYLGESEFRSFKFRKGMMPEFLKREIQDEL